MFGIILVSFKLTKVLQSKICQHHSTYFFYLYSQDIPDFLITKNKYISVKSGAILSHFLEKGKDYFTLKDTLTALPDSKEGTVRELLSDMTRRGLLLRLRSGVYQIIPFDRDPNAYLPDWHLTAAGIVKSVDYYIAYYSALQLHQLITQPALKEQIVVAKQLRPSTITIQRVPFQFIYHKPKHFFGIQRIWVDDFNRVPCSDLEKTIVDCLFKPVYAGGVVEIARALHSAKKKLQFEKLLEYIRQFGSKAVAKRLGLLLEILRIDTPIIDELQKMKTPSYVRLDTELPPSGPHINRWSIQQNVDTETILSAIYT